jgi:hypothetical protein
VTQPDYVPIAAPDRIRPIDRLPVPRSWRSTRPGEVLDPVPPQGRSFGSTGPDLGYGLKLARLLVPKVKMTEGELVADAVAGCFAVGAKRAAMFGRAPVIFDMELAFALWGFLDGAPADLIAFRKPLFMGAASNRGPSQGVDAADDRRPGQGQAERLEKPARLAPSILESPP